MASKNKLQKILLSPVTFPLVPHSKQVSNSDIADSVALARKTSDDHEWKRIYCSHCGAHHDIPVYCGNRFCEVCARGRRMRTRDRLRWIIAQVQPAAPYHINFLTLTVGNMKSAQAQCRKLLKSFRKLRQRAEWKKHVRGGAFVLEVKKGTLGWHVHIHAVIESRFWKWESILTLWHRCSGGTGCFIKQIPHAKAVGYLTKYLSKASVSDGDLIAVLDSLKGLRLFNPFGTWYNLNKTYPKKTFVCPVCGVSDWIWEGRWDKMVEWYGPPPQIE